MIMQLTLLQFARDSQSLLRLYSKPRTNIDCSAAATGIAVPQHSVLKCCQSSGAAAETGMAAAMATCSPVLLKPSLRTGAGSLRAPGVHHARKAW